MSTELKDRVTECMQAKGLKNAALAKICGVEPPTSYNWASGKTKNIKGGPLLKAAAAFGVNPEWLASGKGPKFAIGQQEELTRKPVTVIPVNRLGVRELISQLRAHLEPEPPGVRTAVIAMLKDIADRPEDIAFVDTMAGRIAGMLGHTGNDPLPESTASPPANNVFK